MRVITIIDIFAKNETIENVILGTLDKLKDFDVLLISNEKISKEIQNKVKFSFYDNRNLLFKKNDYIYTQPWNFWIGNNIFTSHNYYYSRQSHALSVLINLFNSINIAKSLGYTHFQSLLYDNKIDNNFLNFMRNVPSLCKESNKNGLVYYNEPNYFNDPISNIDESFPDMSGDYFFCEIDYFLSKIPKINSEDDYRKIIYDLYGEYKFLIYEKYLYDFFKKNGDSELIIKNNFNSEFPIKNETQVSILNFDIKYQGCPTRITKIKNDNEKMVLLSHNFNNFIINRKIIVYKSDNSHYEILQTVPINCWTYSFIEIDIIKIDVYEENKLLYTEYNEKIQNYLEWK